MRTEKSRNENVWKCRSENGKETRNWNIGNFKNFGKGPLFFGHFFEDGTDVGKCSKTHIFYQILKIIIPTFIDMIL